jgi:hypothetical protein
MFLASFTYALTSYESTISTEQTVLSSLMFLLLNIGSIDMSGSSVQNAMYLADYLAQVVLIHNNYPL